MRHLGDRFRLGLWVVAVVSSLGLSVASYAAPARAEKVDPRLAILDKYMDAKQIQQAALRGTHMEVDIDAQLPKLKKDGRLRALRMVSRLGKITYKALGFSGDNTVKQEVITRYLAAESEARENGTISITPEHYKFRYAGGIEMNNQKLQVLEITPRKKAVGLFKGQLWIDTETGMPIRESGEFVKSPSVFLKKIAFVRDYEIRDGVALPYRIQTTVDTRIIGRAQLLIHFTNYAKDEDSDSVSADDSSHASAAAENASGAVAALRAR